MNIEEKNETKGKTTIDPGVLIEIAKLAAQSIPGVAGLAQTPVAIGSVFTKRISNGIKIELENNSVYVDLYLNLFSETDIFRTSKEVQEKVSRSIIEMVGMDVGYINVHIEDIVF